MGQDDHMAGWSSLSAKLIQPNPKQGRKREADQVINQDTVGVTPKGTSEDIKDQ